MANDIRVFVVDDHYVVREGLKRLLGQEEDIKIIGQGADADDALSQLETTSPDVVLMDIKMPGLDGIELTRRMKAKSLPCKVIMLTLYDQYKSQAIEVGAKGYLTKDIKREALAQAIRKVHLGETVFGDIPASGIQNDRNSLFSRRTKEGYSGRVDELKLVLLPPVDVKQLINFTSKMEAVLESSVAKIIGSPAEGIILTFVFNESALLSDMVNRLENIPDVESITENLPAQVVCPIIGKETVTISLLENRRKVTLYVKLEKSTIVAS
jgi:DNA-binding NarL/FixJ family response regulator